MIKFFRHIRKSLLEQNKMGKYFKYAIGEILLVVIGILIALQINNWNERKKEQAFEKEILQQIRANLLKDKITLKEIKGNFEKAMSSTKKILNATWTLEEKDSVQYWLGDIIQFDRFHPLTNAYEVAKSKGLDLITNKQLRFQIGAYYDDELINVGKSIGDIENAFHRDWLDVIRSEALEAKFKQHIILKDISILKGNTEAVNILKLNRGNYSGGHQRLIKVLRSIDNLLSLIKKEIEN
jgi:hypothetical protein